MTTITMIAQPSHASALKAPVFVGIVMNMIVSAMLIVVSAVVLLACMTMHSEMEMFLAENLEHRILASGRPTQSCGSDAMERASDTANCFDHRGFRVVVGDGVAVYSMRHQKPLFIFGLQKGLMFVNERISKQQFEGEKSSFLGYMADATE